MNQPTPSSSSPLPRTLEPEAMDTELEVQEYKQMDHEGINSLYIDDLIAGGPVGPKVMDLGCGTGEIAVMLCQRLDDVQVMGVDMSIEMLEAARMEVELGGVQGRVFLENADCKALDHFESGSTDTVLSNSLIHHVADPASVLACAMHVLAPGGRLFIRDLMRPTTEDEVERLVEEHASGETDFAKQLLRQSLHAALTVAEIRQVAAKCGIDPESIRATSDRHWTLDWSSTDDVA